MHTDTTSGKAVLGRGHLENPDVTVTTDYATAKTLVVLNDQQAAMQAFMQGKIKVQGDMSKIMMPPPPKNDAQKELEEKIKEITE
jgi:putative sterol carrier protein